MTAQLFCTQCGAAGTVGQKFCATCGESLGGSADPRLGTMLGRFQLESVIAAGGFGVVYRAYDTKLQRKVALKLLREELAVGDEFRDRFLRESRAAASLDHQNILPMFDAGEVDGVLYIATRLVDGVDLRKRLAREGLFAIDRALRIVHQIGVALDFAHAKGVVHRDVKPANILLVPGEHGEDEHAYLIDFGITKNVVGDKTLTMTGHFVGTPEYVAPEQIGNDPTDGRADQYALACVLYHCLTGGPPFVRDTTVDLLFAHIHADPPRASAVCTGLPESVDNAITRALSKDATRRFETCRAFVAAARAGTGVPTPAGATASPVQPVPATRTASPATPHSPSSPSPSSSSPSPSPSPPARPAPGRGRTLVLGGVLAALVASGATAGILLGGDSDRGGSTSNASTTSAGGAGPAFKQASRAIDAVEGNPDSLERLGASLQPVISQTTDAIALLSAQPDGEAAQPQLIAAARDQRAFLEFAAQGSNARSARSARSALERARLSGRRAADAYQVIGRASQDLAGALPPPTAFNVGRLRDARKAVGQATQPPQAPPPASDPPPATVATRTFHAPSGNVSCRVTATSAVCTVSKIATSFEFTDGAAARRRTSSVLPHGAGFEAAWDSTVTLGTVRCTIPPQKEARGVRCMDTSTGHGFEASRVPARQRLF